MKKITKEAPASLNVAEATGTGRSSLFCLKLLFRVRCLDRSSFLPSADPTSNGTFL
jgi:hypothetical protein